MAGREGFQRKRVEAVRPKEKSGVALPETRRVERPAQNPKGAKEKTIKPRSKASMMVTIANRGYERAKGPETMAVGILDKGYQDAIYGQPSKQEQKYRAYLKKHGAKSRPSPLAKAAARGRRIGIALATAFFGATGGLSAKIQELDNQHAAEVAARAEHLRDLRAQWDAFREQYAVRPGGHLLTLEDASPRLSEYVRGQQDGSVTLGNLFVPYLGSSGASITLREGEPVSHYDPAAVLENLWNMKCMIAPNARMNAERAVGGYRQLETQGQVWRSTIDAQIEGAYNPSHTGESVTDIIAAHLDWNALQHEYHLSDSQRDLLQAVVAKMSPRDFYSIFLTELMPSNNGAANIAVADTMLRQGGEQMLVKTTSLGDPLNSSTPGQFTFYSFTEWAGIPRVGPLLSEEGYRLLQIPRGAAVNRMPDGQLLTNDSDIKFGNDLATSADEIESIRETEVDVMFNGIGNLANSINNPGVEHFLTQYVHGVVSEREYAVFFGGMHHEPRIMLEAVASMYRHHHPSLYEAVPENDNSNMQDYILRMRGNYDALSSMRPARDSFAERLRHPPEPMPHQ